MVSIRLCVLLILVLVSCAVFAQTPVVQKTKDAHDSGLGYLLNNQKLQLLGEKLFFDQRLSAPVGQSCASCHGAEAGFSGPDSIVNKEAAVYQGAKKNRFGNRKPTTAAYATMVSKFSHGPDGFTGGNFWDGRATGFKLGNPAADQALGPFMNPLEQNLKSAKDVVKKVCKGPYKQLFIELGYEFWQVKNICKSKKYDLGFSIVGIAVAAFEHSDKVSPFTSKYDYYLQGKAQLSIEEKEGLELFEGKGKCNECHPSRMDNGLLPLFTDHTYDNLGLPANPKNPFYKAAKKYNPKGSKWKDPGLYETVHGMHQYQMKAAKTLGLHRVPTLRNVDKRPEPGFIKAFGHNGVFKSLEEIVHFYNTRDTLPKCGDSGKPGVDCWPTAEIGQNINTEELGDLKLTPEEEKAIVTFMKTLSDGYKP
jgi:cytochrome c peroxidase